MTARANLNAIVAACQQLSVPSVSYIAADGQPGSKPLVVINAGSRDATRELAANLRASPPALATMDGETFLRADLDEPDLAVWIRSEDLGPGTLGPAFDRASIAITGVPAAELTARLNDKLRRHPDRRFDDSDIGPPADLDFGAEDDQRTSPAPMQTMAEVVSDGGERPRVSESGPVRVRE